MSYLIASFKTDELSEPLFNLKGRKLPELQKCAADTSCPQNRLAWDGLMKIILFLDNLQYSRLKNKTRQGRAWVGQEGGKGK